MASVYQLPFSAADKIPCPSLSLHINKGRETTNKRYSVSDGDIFSSKMQGEKALGQKWKTVVLNSGQGSLH